MPYHSNDKKKKVVKKKVVNKKTKKTNGLTQKQKDKLKEHSKHHTTKHMPIMKKMMKGGVSFTKGTHRVLGNHLQSFPVEVKDAGNLEAGAPINLEKFYKHSTKEKVLSNSQYKLLRNQLWELGVDDNQ